MERIVQILLTGLICTVALGQFVQVITRYVFQTPVMGLEETMLYPMFWLYMLGAVNASRENSHIRANVLEIFLETERARIVLACLGEVLSLIIGLWLLTWVWDFMRYSWRVWRESPTLYIPVFYADVALLVAMVLMLAWSALHLMRHLRALAGGQAHG
ncbi:TRAP transporter small permease [Seohaeicola saemankumensis]|uniref:TRAP transporter small permease protein n=1 Tax=Seohaeicola saemankumensis TaxID=481181 RepID=A0ABW3T8H6_9RHOB